MGSDIFVLCEQRDGVLQKVSLELLGKARELGAAKNQRIVAALLGKNVGAMPELLVSHGADIVLVAESPFLEPYSTEPYTKAFHAMIKEYEPEIVLVGASSLGRDLAPRLSCRLHTGLTADCTGLEIDAETGGFLMTRPAFGGNIMATIICPEHRPQMATVRPGVMQALPAEKRQGKVIPYNITLTQADMTVEILENVKSGKRSTDITEAKILVSGGRGMGGAANFGILKELAAVLGGEVSASRAAVDAGYADHDRQVGQTGKTVRPLLYLACGISGAIQHTAGMEESDFIVAINKNPSAPIFDIADLGIVGDVFQILPKLKAALSAELE